MSRRRCWPEREIPNIISIKNSLERTNVQRKTESSKNSVYPDGTKKKSTKDPERNPIERPPECKGTYLWDSKELSPVFAL
jgi:hypothetical protein